MPAGRCHCGAGTALAHFGQQPQTGTPPAATGGRFALASRRFVAAHAQAREAGWVQFLAPRQTPGPLGALLVGTASGVLNGAAGIGGPPANVVYFATTGAAVSRATLIAFFLFTDVYALAWAGGTGLLGTAAWPLIVVALPFSLLGIIDRKLL